MEKSKNVIYEHTQVKKMLHYINVWFLPFRWGANTYRGCEHDCVYCNARYTHEYLGLPTGEFAHKIIVKDNAAEVLNKEFSRKKWRKMTVNLATVTDPYQPAEREFKITRQLLKVFLTHHNPLMLTTKSDLVLRDLDILTEIAETGILNVLVTLSTLNEALRKKIEPRVPRVESRLHVIQELHEAGINVGVTAIPLLPYISDSREDIEELVKAVAGAGANFFIVGMLNFREDARTRFMQFLAQYEPDLIPKYEELYQTRYCDKNYAREVRKRASTYTKKYKVDKYDTLYSSRNKG